MLSFMCFVHRCSIYTASIAQIKLNIVLVPSSLISTARHVSISYPALQLRKTLPVLDQVVKTMAKICSYLSAASTWPVQEVTLLTNFIVIHRLIQNKFTPNEVKELFTNYFCGIPGPKNFHS